MVDQGNGAKRPNSFVIFQFADNQTIVDIVTVVVVGIGGKLVFGSTVNELPPSNQHSP